MKSDLTIENEVATILKSASSSKIVLAVSGGIDSMVLLHLLKKFSTKFEVAHCNFNLRGEESEKDYLFVKKISLQNDIVFNGTKFETQSFAKQNGISIQMAARDLRYKWFNEIIQNKKLDLLVTAHHKDDQIETLLLNLFRGKGNFSWEGMHVFQNKIVRPLLNFSKQELIAYAIENKIEWREDSSNEKSEYQRNYLRNELIPQLAKQFPSLENNLLQFAEINKYNNSILRRFINQKKKELCKIEGAFLKINCDLLKHEDDPEMLLFHLIHSYGFNLENCIQLLQSVNSSGKKFFSKNYIALIDRKNILIKKSEVKNNPSIIIGDSFNSVTYNDYLFQFSEIKNQQIELKTNLKSIALIDKALITEQLEIRTYREGDYFHPLGMSGKKLLSDFFIDEKINDFLKTEIPLLCCDGKIIWVAGFRLDDRFKVTENTTSILRVELSVANS